MDEKLKAQYAPVKSELYQLLLAAYCYERKIEYLGDRLQKESRAFLLEEMTALRHLSNGMILHICNLDDSDRSWSLRAMTKELGKMKDYADRTKQCVSILKVYREQINEFKTKHRNQFIAHRNGEDYPDPFALPDLTADFREIIGTAIRALECLWGARLDFGFHLGSQDPTIDFRESLNLS